MCDRCCGAGCDWSSFLVFLVIEHEGKQAESDEALVNTTLEAQGMMPSSSLCVMYWEAKRRGHGADPLGFVGECRSVAWC